MIHMPAQNYANMASPGTIQVQPHASEACMEYIYIHTGTETITIKRTNCLWERLHTSFLCK